MSDPASWQRPLIASRIRECREYLDEAIEANDLDLLEEMSGKMFDALFVFRRKGQASPPATFTFSDGVTRDLDAMAFSHAVSEEFPEMDDSGEWPAWMQRGESEA